MPAQLGLINPALPDDIQQGGMLMCVGRAAGTGYPVTAKPSTSAIATGFRQAGVLAALPTIDVGRETETIKTGAYGLPQAVLFKGITATIKAELYGFDPFVLSLGLGIDPAVTVTAGVAFSGISTDSTTGFSQLTVSAHTFVSGDTLQVAATTDILFSVNIGKVIATTTTTVLLDRLLREQPASGTASKVTSVTLPIGGLTPKQFSFAGIVDFQDGRVGLFRFPRVQSTKPVSIQIGEGQGAIKLPLEMEALGVLDPTYGVTVGSITIWS